MKKHMLKLFVPFVAMQLIILCSSCSMSTSQAELLEDDEIITIEDREYEKIVHNISSDRIEVAMDYFEMDLYKFPEISCYDDVVLYGKQLFSAVYGMEQMSPYTICYNKEYNIWVYTCENLYADGEWIDSNTYLYAYISGDGELLGVFPPPQKDLVISDVVYNTSNAFTFSYDNFKKYSGSSIYNETLEKVTCAEDVLDRATYYYNRCLLTNTGNPYYICYDEVNDCWLYSDYVANEPGSCLTMVIKSNGQVLLVFFFR